MVLYIKTYHPDASYEFDNVFLSNRDIKHIITIDKKFDDMRRKALILNTSSLALLYALITFWWLAFYL